MSIASLPQIRFSANKNFAFCFVLRAMPKQKKKEKQAKRQKSPLIGRPPKGKKEMSMKAKKKAKKAAAPKAIFCLDSGYEIEPNQRRTIS